MGRPCGSVQLYKSGRCFKCLHSGNKCSYELLKLCLFNNALYFKPLLPSSDHECLTVPPSSDKADASIDSTPNNQSRVGGFFRCYVTGKGAARTVTVYT